MDESNTDPGKWTLNLHEARPPSTETEDLCFTCDELVQKIIWPTQSLGYDGNQSFNIGWIDRMAATKYCDCCQFLLSLFVSNNAVNPGVFDDRHRVLCSMSLGCERLSSSGMRLAWDLSVGFLANEEVEATEATRSLVQNGYPQLNFNLDIESLGRVCGLETGAEQEDVFYHLGRTVQDDIPGSFLRDGFDICKKYHGDDCERPKHILKKGAQAEETPDLRFLRVIDVQQKCLLPLPPGANYVALSYTWSPEPYTSLLKENKVELESSGGIELKNLPPTIADAMTVVEMLGERYLWADRLCIVQDDPRDKRVQINQMDIVYRYATLTIVAAAISDGTSDAGLPGISADSRRTGQTIATVKGLTFVETKSWLEETISKSRWHKRAWTFQEHLLSKRHLIFTPVRAVFTCAKDTFPEDYVRKAQFRSGLIRNEYETPDTSDDVHANGIPSMPLAYEIMVRWYTGRSLTVESDILKGISGLLRTVTRETGHRFLSGMPMTNLLDHFLLWIPSGRSRRRGKNAFDLDFPSWSWAGWVGAAIYTITGDLLDGRSRVVFDEEPLVKDECRVLISKGGQQYDPHSFGEIEDDVLLNLEWCKLSFTAPCAKAQMSTTVWGYFSDCNSDELGDASRCHSIFVDSKFAGMIQAHLNLSPEELKGLEATPADALRSAGTRIVELIALSTTYHPWPVYFPLSEYSRDDVNFYYTNREGEEKDHLPFDTDVWDDEDPEMVNVMLIQWNGDVASRTGIGQIPSDAWGMLGVEEKAIVLG